MNESEQLTGTPNAPRRLSPSPVILIAVLATLGLSSTPCAAVPSAAWVSGECDIGPKTYARVFELLLRLKANTLWPAMHECTRPFNSFPENKQVADDYAIVMGSSHAESMLRNNV